MSIQQHSLQQATVINYQPADAIEYVFADSKKYAPLLLEFMTIERDCCPSAAMNLKFEPNSSRVSLILGGSQKLKERYKP